MVKLFMARDSYTGKKYHLTARVLYADGSVGTISMEEAEQLVSKYSPVPIELKPETTDGTGVRSGDGEQNADRNHLFEHTFFRFFCFFLLVFPASCGIIVREISI